MTYGIENIVKERVQLEREREDAAAHGTSCGGVRLGVRIIDGDGCLAGTESVGDQAVDGFDDRIGVGQ